MQTTEQTIQDLFAKHGKNLRFLVPMLPVRTVLFISYTTSSDKHQDVLCEVVEDRYKVDEGYKISLSSMYEGFGRKDFYQSDLGSLIKMGTVKVFLDLSDQFAE